MRLVFIYHSLSAHGGLERVLADKMNYLADVFNYDVWFITTDQNEKSYSYKLSEKIHHTEICEKKYFDRYKVGYPMRLKMIIQFEKHFKCCLKSILEQIKPDFIIANTAYMATAIADIKIAGCKKILESHIAYVYTLKAGSAHSDLNVFNYFFKTIYDFLFCRKISKFDILVVLTEEDRKAWKSRFKRIVKIPNPVTFFPNEVSDVSSKKIIAVGRIGKQKGFDLLIASWAKISQKHPGWQVHIYGDNNESLDLNDLIKQNHVVDSVFIHPAVKNIYEKYEESEFLVLSSRSEGFGLVLVEAMSCARPCVSFKCPSGPSEIIRHGVDGLLAQAEDTEDLANKIDEMILKEKERKEMGTQARLSAEQFRINHIMEQWHHLFSNEKY